jgi:hypothetical protein
MRLRARVVWIALPLTLVVVVLGAAVGLLLKVRADQNRQLDNLYDYQAPIFIWDKEVLSEGVETSKPIPQVPVQLPDGHVEVNKAIVLERGDWDGTSFVKSSDGKWFALTLLEDGEAKGTAVGLLLPEGYGAAVTCKPPKPPPPPNPLPPTSVFNCFFIVTLEADGGVRVHWTMFHRGSESGLEGHGSHG